MKYYPRTVFVDILDKCNLRCKHCIKAACPENQNYMTLENVKKIFDQLKKLNTEKIVISGGEPLLHKDFFSILEYACNIFRIVYIDTNGTLLTEETINKIIKFPNAKFQISLDGPNKESHEAIRGESTFDKTVEGIKRLLKHNRIPIIATIIHKENYKFLSEMHSFLEEMNIQLWRLMAMMKKGRAVEFYDELTIGLNEWNKVAEVAKTFKGNMITDVTPMFRFIGKKMPNMSNEQIESLGCEAGKFRACVLSNGDIITCSMFPNMVAGNVNKTPFEEVWENSPVMKEFRYYDYNKVKGCEKCQYSKYCKGGCHGMALEVNGDLYTKDPRCPE